MIATIPVNKPFLWGNELVYVSEAIKSGWLSSRGSYVEVFEEQFRQRVGRNHALTVSNGTTAVHLALECLGIKPGDEIIVPAFCMMSPIFAVMYCGATPVPVDIDDTWNLNPHLLEQAITERTRAILVVHNYGHPASIEIISAIADEYNIPLVEDAAEVLGATVSGREVGVLSRITCYSFYSNKLITTGEGGMITMDDSRLYEKAKWKRNLCFGADDENRFLHQEIGFNYRLSNLQAAVGLAQLEHLDEAIKSKIEIARQYNKKLSDLQGLTLPPEADWATNVFWVYGIVINPDFGISRRFLQSELAKVGIETRRFFSPLNKQPFFNSISSDIVFPQSEYLSNNGLYLPSYIGMTDFEINRVVDSILHIQKFYSS